MSLLLKTTFMRPYTRSLFLMELLHYAAHFYGCVHILLFWIKFARYSMYTLHMLEQRDKTEYSRHFDVAQLEYVCCAQIKCLFFFRKKDKLFTVTVHTVFEWDVHIVLAGCVRNVYTDYHQNFEFIPRRDRKFIQLKSINISMIYHRPKVMGLWPKNVDKIYYMCNLY